MWYHDAPVVSSSYLVGGLLESSWHLRLHFMFDFCLTGLVSSDLVQVKKQTHGISGTGFIRWMDFPSPSHQYQTDYETRKLLPTHLPTYLHFNGHVLGEFGLASSPSEKNLYGQAAQVSYGLDVLPVTQQIVSKHSGKHKPLNPTSGLASFLSHPPPDYCQKGHCSPTPAFRRQYQLTDKQNTQTKKTNLHTANFYPQVPGSHSYKLLVAA